LKFIRSSGVLLHPTSLAGRFGIGDLGAGAYRFADWLASAGQKIWHVLPLGPTGYGDSPYQCLSTFAGNPLLIDLDQLAGEGLLTRADLAGAPAFPEDVVDYAAVIKFKREMLARAFRRFSEAATPAQSADFRAFAKREANWLDDFSLFMASKNAHSGAPWTRWSPPLSLRPPEAFDEWRQKLRHEIAAEKFAQYVFFRQWHDLAEYCHNRGIRIMGDLPFYVAHDSADVWAGRNLFLLDPAGEPAFVAGVPPDYFCATGQLWGNPIYRWEAIANSGYAFWVARFKAALGLFDMLRLDHFRGFESYWQVPAGEPTAMRGEWVKGPGADLFDAVEGALGNLPVVAENLGVITPAVERLREKFGYPGMSVLQFAFGTDPQAAGFRPHNYPCERAAYTGTHDNDTAVGWWTSTGSGDSTRTRDEIRREREFARLYLGTDGAEINWALIRAVLASVADTAMFPLQDVLGLASEARMNLPGRPEGNWRWRLAPGMLSAEVAGRLRELTLAYDR
jgi:4-alpha-glucanotransferase